MEAAYDQMMEEEYLKSFMIIKNLGWIYHLGDQLTEMDLDCLESGIKISGDSTYQQFDWWRGRNGRRT